MKWEEVRNIYPNKFVLLRSLEAHIEDNKKCICSCSESFR